MALLLPYSALGQSGGLTKLVPPKSMTNAGGGLLKESFDQVFSESIRTSSDGEHAQRDPLAELGGGCDQVLQAKMGTDYTKRAVRAAMLVLSVAFAVIVMAISGFEADSTTEQDDKAMAKAFAIEGMQHAIEGVQHAAEQEPSELECYDSLSPQLQNSLLAEELLADHEALPELAQQEIEDALGKACQETSLESLCETSVDAALGLFEQPSED